jgi:hypothetical protein
LKLAIEKGYKILDIYHVLHYDKTTDTLFKDYIMKWIQLKATTSGFPSWVKTETDKDDYIQLYYEKEGIKLVKEDIQVNPALRYIAKIMVNSFWGKLAQRPNMPHTEHIHTQEQYWNLVTDERKEVKGELNVTDNLMLMSWKFKNELDAEPGNTNIAIAAHVTAYARIKLYKAMEEIERQVPESLLYFDTDSVIYVRKDGEPELEKGDFMGELASEIPQGSRCIQFVSLGPKNYGYTIRNSEGKDETTLKVKGLRLSKTAMETVSLPAMKEMAMNYVNKVEDVRPVTQLNIVTDRNHMLYTRIFKKDFRAVSEKRNVCGNGTLPYGF